jgi:hypothetical protein
VESYHGELFGGINGQLLGDAGSIQTLKGFRCRYENVGCVW